MTEHTQRDEEGKQLVKLVLDADAAAVLPGLAGSPRKQGAYVSALIREAAARRAQEQAEQADAPALRQLVTDLIREVEALKQERVS